MIFTLVMLILLTIVIALMVLSAQRDNEREAEQKREREQMIETHLRMVRSKYAGEEPMGYKARKHVDFTGGEPMKPAELEAIKMEVTR